jgi:hypothetical protein
VRVRSRVVYEATLYNRRAYLAAVVAWAGASAGWSFSDLTCTEKKRGRDVKTQLSQRWWNHEGVKGERAVQCRTYAFGAFLSCAVAALLGLGLHCLLAGLLGFGFVDVLHQHTLVLELVTFAAGIQVVVPNTHTQVSQ